VNPKPWPPFPETIDIEEATHPLHEAVHASAKDRSPVAVYLEAGGYDLGDDAKAVCRGPVEEIEGSPRGAAPMWKCILARVLRLSFLLGTEQGLRIAAKRDTIGASLEALVRRLRANGREADAAAVERIVNEGAAAVLGTAGGRS